jgi:hypothetical protein
MRQSLKDTALAIGLVFVILLAVLAAGGHP